MNKSVLIANLSYNPHGWRSPYRNPKASHSYATRFPGHESLNFKFDKKGVDTNKKVHGFVQWTADPKGFQDGGIVLFYSMNTDTRSGEIVGIYGNVRVFPERKSMRYTGFENNRAEFNLEADRNLSLLFPIPLPADQYKETQSKRLVGQIGFSYYDEPLALRIIRDEIIALKKSGLRQVEYSTLKSIYTYINDGPFDEIVFESDLVQQDELIEVLETDRSQIIKDLLNLEEDSPEEVTVKHKTYKRDNKTIAQLKILRNFECQICSTKIEKSGGGYYIEAAHIKAKSDKGRETPDNILILCPNHHKEFDFGERQILSHSKDSIEVIINGKRHNLSLKVK
jgi:HNH endonuclease